MSRFLTLPSKRLPKPSPPPFALLVRLFSGRMFYGDGEGGSQDELGIGIGLVLALLALPGGFVSILLIDKYSTLLHWMRGQRTFDPYAACIPDEYLFIVLSMVVTGAVLVWKWGNTFPGRRDYMNLVPLPIRMRTIFFANLLALLFVTGTVAVDVNAASGVLFPFVVSASQNTFKYWARLAGAHTLTVLLTSVFVFLAVLALLGLLMAILPQRVFRRSSPYLRGVIIICLLLLLSTTFSVPPMLQQLPSLKEPLIRLLPSCWFLGLFERLLGNSRVSYLALGKSALLGLAISLAIAICAYGVSYRRYFERMAEMEEITGPRSRRGFPLMAALLDRVVFRTPVQRGCSRFVWKTLLRSERHALAVAGFVGLALILASQALMGAVEGKRVVGQGTVSPDALSVPLILAYCVIVGLRLTFEVPAELGANWTFRLFLDANTGECIALAKRIVSLLVLPGLVLLALPVYWHIAGPVAALLHTSLVVAWSALLTQSLFARFRKLPFTCSLPGFQQHALVTASLGALGFAVFAVITPEVEHWALSDPLRMSIFVPPAVGAWYFVRRLRPDTTELERELIFEAPPERTVEVLQLGEIT